jgi:hypothetical protein
MSLSWNVRLLSGSPPSLITISVLLKDYLQQYIEVTIEVFCADGRRRITFGVSRIPETEQGGDSKRQVSQSSHIVRHDNPP